MERLLEAGHHFSFRFPSNPSLQRKKNDSTSVCRVRIPTCDKHAFPGSLIDLIDLTFGSGGKADRPHVPFGCVGGKLKLQESNVVYFLSRVVAAVLESLCHRNILNRVQALSIWRAVNSTGDGMFAKSHGNPKNIFVDNIRDHTPHIAYKSRIIQWAADMTKNGEISAPKIKSTVIFDDAHGLVKLTTTVERQIELVPVPISKQSPDEKMHRINFDKT